MPDPERSWVSLDFLETILSRNGASEYGPCGTSRGAPVGRPEGGRVFNRASHRGAKPDFALCLVGAHQHSRLENSTNMPSALAKTSTEHSQEYTFLFQKKKSGNLPDLLGTPPKSLYESHAWHPLNFGALSLSLDDRGSHFLLTTVEGTHSGDTESPLLGGSLWKPSFCEPGPSRRYTFYGAPVLPFTP